jgi:hypothetical protein
MLPPLPDAQLSNKSPLLTVVIDGAVIEVLAVAVCEVLSDSSALDVAAPENSAAHMAVPPTAPVHGIPPR